MMHLLLRAVLLTATATAQLTTSFWAPLFPLGSDKIGYYGSVINANASHTTYFLTFDNGTDYTALGYGYSNQTMTVGPNIYEQSTTVNFGVPRPVTGVDMNAYILRCEREDRTNANANATCTASYGPNYVYAMACDVPRTGTETQVWSRTITHSGRLSYSAGVETILQTYILLPDTEPVPAWCEEGPGVRTVGSATTFDALPTSFGTFQVVVTAGLEKLDATQGAGVTASSAQPTATGPPSGASSVAGSSGLPEATGAAVALRMQGGVVMGLGVAAAALVVQDMIRYCGIRALIS
ncbi:hypothetical protein IAQ61_011402 [Plenodomus lingam]|uniref:uncharacterized protein n=1 Tax=Leptosphaeria maculans TaxID=5022 RepID=UPI003332DB46|nr:hypothetical protein IAQ61_011402 [Plenodomus lingam]